MRNYTQIQDIQHVNDLIDQAILLKKQPYKDKAIGKNLSLVMLFFNSSLRTRLSTEKAARNLGMEVMVLNVNDAWDLEFEDGTVMNGNSPEHIKDAARIISQYADIIAVRAFPSLTDKRWDESEPILSAFTKYATVPIVNMESATGHPLQALADAITILEQLPMSKPNVVLSWAPHPKALPQAVANSFCQMMTKLDINLTITHPEGYELNPKFTSNFNIMHDQKVALEGADLVYVKNWSSYNNYGRVLSQDESWMMTKTKLGKAKFMHCLPVRRNVVVADEVLDSDQSLVVDQANNRTFAAQIVLKTIITSLKS